jgi:hypothetical protein
LYRASQPKPRHPRISGLRWIRVLLSEARRSDPLVSIFKKGQSRNKKASGSEATIRLLLIILWAIVVVVLGLYGGLATSHHH